MILFADFWLPLFTDPSISHIFITYVLLSLIFISVITGAIIGKKYFSKSRVRTLESRLEPRNMKIGLCLGSLTNSGARILGRSEYCPFNEPQLHSMLENSVVCVLHGDVGNLIGPFPIMGNLEDMFYVSFGFRERDNPHKPRDLTHFIESGGTLGFLLLYYPNRLDPTILIRKKHITDSFKDATDEISHVSELLPEKLARIEEDIQFLLLF